MCLAVPGQVLEVFAEDDVRMARVAFAGVARRVCVEHVPDVVPGEYVLVHVGFALQRIDAVEAERIFAMLAELGALHDEEPPP
jgi:hydrogenase expression/formation protein HypC